MMKTDTKPKVVAIAVAIICVATNSLWAQQNPGTPPVAPNGFPAQPGAQGKPKPSIRVIEMRPSEKRQLSLKIAERNPYARRAEGQSTSAEIGPDSEEARIRKTLSSLAVSGSSRGPNNDLKVQMGDITLEIGRILPKLLVDQTENLQVTELTEDSITLGWMDVETGELTGKSMQVAYDLSPSITYQLSGQNLLADSKRGATPAKPKMGVLRIGKQRRVQAAELYAKDPARNLPREVYEAAQ